MAKREESAEKREEKIKSESESLFLRRLKERLNDRELTLEQFCDLDDEVESRVLREYGAVFLAFPTKVHLPNKCAFSSEDEVQQFQSSVAVSSAEIGGAQIELQTEAMRAYLAALEEAKTRGLKITPRDGTEAAKRSFADTVRLWNSRFFPACEHWKKQGRLTEAQVQNLKSLPMREQVKEVLRLEKQGIFFNTYFNASILRSVAAPGTSQHLLMLALDINEYADKEVRRIMNKHGWFRTVKNDEPHFTFLGYSEDKLKLLGLKKLEPDFWVPDIR